MDINSLTSPISTSTSKAKNFGILIIKVKHSSLSYPFYLEVEEVPLKTKTTTIKKLK